MKFEKSAGAIIFHLQKDEPYYLLLKYPTYWGFVKGLIEKNETEERTIKREASEETSLHDLVFISGFRKTQSYSYKLKGNLIRKHVVFLLAKTESWTVRLSYEHEDYKWCTYEQALKLLKISANKQLLKKAHAFLLRALKQKKVLDYV